MTEFKLRPLNDRVWVEPIEQEGTTASGIILPETAKEKPQLLQKSYRLVPFATLFVALFHPFDTLMGYDMVDR